MLGPKYKEWLDGVNRASMEVFGCPFFVVCSNPQMPRKAFQENIEPGVFIEKFKKDYKPHVASEMFF